MTIHCPECGQLKSQCECNVMKKYSIVYNGIDGQYHGVCADGSGSFGADEDLVELAKYMIWFFQGKIGVDFSITLNSFCTPIEEEELIELGVIV